MVLFVVHLAGGMSMTVSVLSRPEMAPALSAAGPFPGWVVLWSLVFVTSVGPWGLPQMVQKFYSIKSEADVKRAMVVASAFALVLSFGAYFTGALTHLFYYTPVEGVPAPAGMTPVPENLDDLMPHFLTHYVPAWVSMVILLLVFSASMSSLSSLVLVSSSAIAVDLYAGLRRDASKESIMLLMRVLCGVFVAISLVMALKKVDFIVNLMVISWGALAGAFLAPYCFGLFWKRTSKAGAIAGMVSGLATMVLIYSKYGGPGVPVAGAMGIVVPVIVVPLVSLLTPPPDREILDRAFGEAAGRRRPRRNGRSVASGATSDGRGSARGVGRERGHRPPCPSCCWRVRPGVWVSGERVQFREGVRPGHALSGSAASATLRMLGMGKIGARSGMVARRPRGVRGWRARGAFHVKRGPSPAGGHR